MSLSFVAALQPSAIAVRSLATSLEPCTKSRPAPWYFWWQLAQVASVLVVATVEVGAGGGVTAVAVAEATGAADALAVAETSVLAWGGGTTGGLSPPPHAASAAATVVPTRASKGSVRMRVAMREGSPPIRVERKRKGFAGTGCRGGSLPSPSP